MLVPSRRAQATAPAPTHGIAMHGGLALPPDFTHFPHANPSAPKGGRLTIAIPDSFDTVNPFIPRGSSPPEVRSLTFESLLARNWSERFSLYALVAQRVEMPDDRRSITFHLNPAARFADGKSIGVRDIQFSIAALTTRGTQGFRRLGRAIAGVEIVGESAIRIAFNDQGDRETPLLVSLFPIMPSHLLTVEQFENRTLSPMVGSGPYAIQVLEPGRRLVYRRRPDHWARDLPVYRGRHNFDEVRVEYMHDASAVFEAFRTGDVDIRFEDNASTWLKGYDFPAARQGRVVRREIESRLPAGLAAIAFNARRPLLADPRVREALLLAVDAEWLNQNLFHGLYARIGSIFPRSEFVAAGTPASPAERALLGSHASRIHPDILDGRWRPPSAKREDHNRENLVAAMRLLESAGFVTRNGRLFDPQGRLVTLEFIAQNVPQERLMILIRIMWARLGVGVAIRRLDAAQYWERMKSHDYDLIQWTWQPTISPGNEQVGRWSSASTRNNEVLNLTGILDPAADRALEALVAATTIEDLTTAARALDRVIMSGHYFIPLFYAERIWVAHWRHLRQPAMPTLAPTDTDTWWMDGEK